MTDNSDQKDVWKDPIKKAYVAFIDVLGFSHLVDSDFDDIVQRYDSMINGTAIVETLRPDVSLRVFSDAFILVSSSFERIVGAVQMVLMQTLFNDFMVRGGIAYGRHIEKAGDGRLQVVSEALVKAVRTEKSIRYPCVALDESVITNASWWTPGTRNLHRPLLYFDGLRLVNPCNSMWGSSAAMRVIQLRQAHPNHSDKHDWFLRLHSAIFSDTPLVPHSAEMG